MKIDIITIFPHIFDQFLKESLLARAQKNKLLEIRAHDLRAYSTDKHKKVDDKPFGGGLGMVMKVEPILRAVRALKSKRKKTKVLLFTPRGAKFTQKKANEYAELDQLICICGRYEGIDERVAQHIADEEISIGDYVLMGGEVPAMAVIETVSRLIPGVVGKPEFLKERKVKNAFIEYPQYTRPETVQIIKNKKRITAKVPQVLLSGDHKKIAEWRLKHGSMIGK